MGFAFSQRIVSCSASTVSSRAIQQGFRCNAIDQDKQANSFTCNVNGSRTIPLTISLGFLDFFRGGAGFFLGEAMSEGFADGSPLLA